MGKLLQSIFTLIITMTLICVGTFAYFSKPEIQISNTFSAGTMDLVMKLNNIGENSWDQGWLIWDNQTKDQPISKKLVLENQGTLPGELTLSFAYKPKNDYLAKNIFLSKVFRDNQDITSGLFKTNTPENNYTISISLYDLSILGPLDQGIMKENDKICYRFVFSNNLEVISEPIKLQIIVTAILSQY